MTIASIGILSHLQYLDSNGQYWTQAVFSRLQINSTVFKLSSVDSNGEYQIQAVFIRLQINSTEFKLSSVDSNGMFFT